MSQHIWVVSNIYASILTTAVRYTGRVS